MKKLTWIIILILCIGLSSCSKDDTTTTTTDSNIIGKWQMVERTPITTLEPCIYEGWLEIKSNGEYIEYEACEDYTSNGTWKREGNTITIITNNFPIPLEYDIVSVSDNELVLKYSFITAKYKRLPVENFDFETATLQQIRTKLTDDGIAWRINATSVEIADITGENWYCFPTKIIYFKPDRYDQLYILRWDYTVIPNIEGRFEMFEVETTTTYNGYTLKKGIYMDFPILNQIIEYIPNTKLVIMVYDGNNRYTHTYTKMENPAIETPILVRFWELYDYWH